MVYVDTSVLVPLFLHEPHSGAAAEGYAREKRELVAAARRVPEFASALGIKQRTGAIGAQRAQVAWQRFERMAAADLRLLAVAPANFLRTAKLVLHAARALCAGDALTDADKRGKTTIQWSFGGRDPLRPFAVLESRRSAN